MTMKCSYTECQRLLLVNRLDFLAMTENPRPVFDSSRGCFAPQQAERVFHQCFDYEPERSIVVLECS